MSMVENLQEERPHKKGRSDRQSRCGFRLVRRQNWNAYTAMKEIRKKPSFKKLPIIALTAKAMKEDRQKCIAAGANDYVPKPVDVDQLLTLLRVWLTRKTTKAYHRDERITH